MAEDNDIARIAYDIMAMQAASRQRGPGPSYGRESNLGRRLTEPLPQAQLDWQEGYALPEEPTPPSTGPNMEPNFMDRTMKLLRGMGMTGTQLANFIGRTAASGSGPRFSNREIVGTEIESPSDIPSPNALPVTYERGVGFSPLSAERRRGPSPYEVAEGFFNPAAGFAGILGRPIKILGHKEAIRRGVEARKMESQGATPQHIWDKLAIERGVEGGWRAELPGFLDTQALQELIRDASERGQPIARQLGEVMSGRAIQAYPEAQDAWLTMHPRRAGISTANYTPNIRTIKIEPSIEDPLSVIAGIGEHEGQHLTARMTNLPPGANPRTADPNLYTPFTTEELARLANLLKQELPGVPHSSIDRWLSNPEYLAYFQSAGETEARNAARRLENPVLRRLAPAKTEDLPRSKQWVPYSMWKGRMYGD